MTKCTSVLFSFVAVDLKNFRNVVPLLFFLTFISWCVTKRLNCFYYLYYLFTIYYKYCP